MIKAYQRFRRTVKRDWRMFLYSGIAVLLLFFLLTVVLGVLENQNLLETVRPDDRVGYEPVRFLTKVAKPTGDEYRIENPAMLETTFLVKKPENTFRIFITGGSFAMGSPYVVQGKYVLPGSIGHWVEAELKMRFPDKNFEVINAAAGAQNSARVLGIVKKLARLETDLILVAMGNNEGYLPVTELNRILHKWVVYRLLKRTLLPPPPPMKRSYYMPQDSETQNIINEFQTRVSSIVTACQASQTPLVLATLPINLKYVGRPDLESAPPAGDPQMEAGDAFRKEGKYKEAIEQYSKSEHTIYASRSIAQCYEEMGEYEEAKRFYRAVVQFMPQNRTRPSFNETIRKTCKAKGVILVDMEKALDDVSSHGIPNPDIYIDYCHMTWWGYHLMAEQVVDAIIASGLIDRGKTQPNPRPTARQIIEHFGWQALYDLDETRRPIEKSIITRSRSDYLPGGI